MGKNTYCVIGGAGFIGSHVVDKLVEQGKEVLVLDNLISGALSSINHKAKYEWFDIRDSEYELAKILENYDVEYVLNYAAEPYIPEGFERPKHFFLINAVGVLNVLEACRMAQVKRFLQVSSAEIYGEMKGKAREDERIQPHSTYGVSKVAADGLCQVRYRESGVPVVILRQFNCVGPRETHEYVIPEIISQLARSNVVHLGNNTYRDFLYVEDAAEMGIEIMHKGELGEVYNMGSEEAIKIYDLAEMIGELMGYSSTEIVTDQKRFRPWDIEFLQSDNTKLYKVIESRSKTSLREALRKTIDWFYANGEKWSWEHSVLQTGKAEFSQSRAV